MGIIVVVVYIDFGNISNLYIQRTLQTTFRTVEHPGCHLATVNVLPSDGMTTFDADMCVD